VTADCDGTILTKSVLALLANPRAQGQVPHGSKMLPNQEFMCGLYKNHHIANGGLFASELYGLLSVFSKEYSSDQFERHDYGDIPVEQMSTPATSLAIIGMIAHLIGARTALEIGTFIGNTAMHFARMMGDGSHVTTIECGHQFAEVARKNFERNGLAKRITLIEGNAGTILPTLGKEYYDLIFIDGGKQDYLEYTLKCERLLSERGVIIVDDVFFHGDALNTKPQTEKGRGCKALLDSYREREDLGKLLLPVGNGMLMLFRK
jgi:predicted O-methyltransferase YrrM